MRHKLKSIYIQQKNAKPHACDNVEVMLTEGTKYGCNIQVKSQSPNSPYLNVLDFVFFCNSIQLPQHQESPKIIGELIEWVFSMH